MKKADIVARAADKLLALCDEHGTPNNFAPHEFNMWRYRMMLGLYAAAIGDEVARRRPDLRVSYTKNGGFDKAADESRYGWFEVSVAEPVPALREHMSWCAVGVDPNAACDCAPNPAAPVAIRELTDAEKDENTADDTCPICHEYESECLCEEG